MENLEEYEPKKEEEINDTDEIPPPPDEEAPDVKEAKTIVCKSKPQIRRISDNIIHKIMKQPADISNYITIVHLSDTHTKHDPFYVPKGDIFIYSGDFSNYNEWKRGKDGKAIVPQSVIDFNEKFLGKLDHKFKFVICGNHDYLNSFSPKVIQKQILKNCIYLQDSSFVIDLKKEFGKRVKKKLKMKKLKVHGSPWSRHNMAFGSGDLKSKWKTIPNDTRILITHTPPHNIMDLAYSRSKSAKSMKKCSTCGEKHYGYAHWGCPFLKERVEKLKKKKLLCHCFGHVHDVFGMKIEGEKFVYMNGSNPRMTFRKPLVYYLRITK